MVVGLVGIDLAGPGPPPTGQGQYCRHIVQQRREHGGVARVGSRHRRGQRQAVPLADQMKPGSRLAAIDGIRAHVVPPRVARTLAESTLARDQSSRRQAVDAEPPPSSLAGSRAQGVEVRAMNTRAAKQLRWGMVRCRPP
jgi:hypothetical protein